jgi:hypothetical protein
MGSYHLLNHKNSLNPDYPWKSRLLLIIIKTRYPFIYMYCFFNLIENRKILLNRDKNTRSKRLVGGQL